MVTQTHRLPLLFIALSVTLLSCIQTSAPDRTKRFTLRFSADDLGSELIQAGDTLRINRIVFHVPGFEARTTDDQIITSLQPFFIDYDEGNLGLNISILSEDLGFLETDGYNFFQFSVDTVSAFQTNQNPILFRDTRFFSIFLDMQWNNDDFEFRTQLKRDVEFNFSSVAYSEENETMEFTLTMQPYSWFIDANADTLIDPTNLFNGRQIDNNIFDAAELEVRPTTVFQ